MLIAAPANADTKGGKTRMGFVLPDLANPFIAGIRDGAVVEAKKQVRWISGWRDASVAIPKPE